MIIRENIQNTISKGQAINQNTSLSLIFIKDRNDLIDKTGADISSSKNSVDFIVSGLEVPNETILAYKQAVDRGVKVRAIVQNLNDTSKEMFKNWEKIGVNVRFHPQMEARIFIIDSKIVYFTSYNPNEKDEAIGIRFDYPTLAKLMYEIFEARWKKSKPIT